MNNKTDKVVYIRRPAYKLMVLFSWIGGIALVIGTLMAATMAAKVGYRIVDRYQQAQKKMQTMDTRIQHLEYQYHRLSDIIVQQQMLSHEIELTTSEGDNQSLSGE